MKKTVAVVAAVIEAEGKVFATQRGYGPWKDGWEFPGGKIEPGETPQAALKREIREELDAEIAVGEKIAQVEYDYPDFHLSMGCYRCAVASGCLTLKEHEAARWLAPDALDSVAWLPADRIAVDALRHSR
ncbi:MAG: (deoxy)nucleoside triphosphate pyrophosphohydrolase [Clostridia bacterium]|nr:(deoxy)nucleoside triphosphate pyrophosphohydrolase [Clostridia bacterium]